MALTSFVTRPARAVVGEHCDNAPTSSSVRNVVIIAEYAEAGERCVGGYERRRLQRLTNGPDVPPEGLRERGEAGNGCRHESAVGAGRLVAASTASLGFVASAAGARGDQQRDRDQPFHGRPASLPSRRCSGKRYPPPGGTQATTCRRASGRGRRLGRRRSGRAGEPGRARGGLRR